MAGFGFVRFACSEERARAVAMLKQPFLVFLLLLVVLAVSCQHRPPELLKPASIPSYSALIHCTISFRNHSSALLGGCAVDPARGVRVEFRDAMGGTKLLLFLDDEEATAVVPESRTTCAWSKASSAFPWSASDLWALFTGKFPSRRGSGGEKSVRAVWRNDRGKVRAELTTSAGGTLERGVLKGPRGFRLEMDFSRVEIGAFSSKVFELPSESSNHYASPSEVFSGILP